MIKVHAGHLKLAKVDDWEIPKTSEGRPIRKAMYVVPPPDTDKSSSDSSESESVNPQRKLAAKYHSEREDSDDEEDIPLMELAKCFKARECHEAEEKAPISSESNSQSDTSDTESMSTIDYELSDSVLVDQVKALPAETSVENKRLAKVKRSKRDRK